MYFGFFSFFIISFSIESFLKKYYSANVTVRQKKNLENLNINLLSYLRSFEKIYRYIGSESSFRG